MLGYIKPEIQELRLREYDIYNGYYCGLCKETGELYGQLCRLWLSNDMAFLALFLGGLTGQADKLERQHCIIHPITRKPVECYEQAIKYACDMMILLGYEKYQDDVRDGQKPSALRFFRIESKYKKSAELHPEVASQVHEALLKLYAYEEPGKSNVKAMADAFGEAMMAVFTGFPIYDEAQKRAVAEFADNLGKWLYLIDLIDDFSEDQKENRFNPILDLQVKDRAKAVEMTKPALYHYLGEMCKAYELLTFRKNKDILDNVIYLGLRRVTDDVLQGKVREDDKRSICCIGRE